MMAREYRKRVTSLDSAWTFTKPTKKVNYDPGIKTLTTELTKSQKEAEWELQRDDNEVYLRIKEVWKEKSSNITADRGSRKSRAKCSTSHTSQINIFLNKSISNYCH